jgi:DNA-binding FadR family transcriptional regulator
LKQSTNIFKRISSKRTFENIADQIKDLIYSKTLKPGDRLPSERELSLLFGTGRMAVREALRILEVSGFVYVRPGADGGTFVRELDSTGMTKSISDLIKVGNITVEELTEARISIESSVIESVIVRITEKELAAVEENIIKSEHFYGQRNESNKAWDNEPLLNFHVLLAEISQNSLYKYFLQSLTDLSISTFQKLKPTYQQNPDHIKQHKAIFKAIKAKDMKKAKKAIQDHLYWVAEQLGRRTSPKKD